MATNKMLDHVKNMHMGKIVSNQMPNAILNKPKNVLKENNDDVLEKQNALKQEYETEQNLHAYWKQRKNVPYKAIFVDQIKSDYKSQEELIIYKTTEQDRIGVKEEYDKKVNSIMEHDDQLKKIYADDKKDDHYRKFMHGNNFSKRVDLKSGNNANSVDFNELKKKSQIENAQQSFDMASLTQSLSMMTKSTTQINQEKAINVVMSRRK